MTRTVFFFLLGGLVSPFFVPSAGWAHPRWAVKEGVGCQSCHVNPSGSGKRNDAGGQFFLETLSLRATEPLFPKEVNGRLNRFVAVGADFDLQNQTTFSSPIANTTTIPQGSLFLELNGGKHLTAYFDQDMANTTNRELFAMLHDNLPARLYLKAGRFYLPYGLRIEDDTNFIRMDFNQTFANQDIGLEAGWLSDSFEVIAAVSNGVPGGVGDENSAKAVTTQWNCIGTIGRLGTSFQWNPRANNRLWAGGLHGGVKFWKLIGLAEVDLLDNRNRSNGNSTHTWAGFGEIDYLVIDGFLLKAIYDYRDPDFEAPDNLEHRIGFGFDLYPIPYSHVSMIYRIQIGSGAAGEDTFLARLHFFF